MDYDAAVVAFLYSCDNDPLRHQTVCEIIERVEMIDEGFGIEPAFRVRFADGAELEALASNLSPWFPV